MNLFADVSSEYKTELGNEDKPRLWRVKFQFNGSDWIDVTRWVKNININKNGDGVYNNATSSSATLTLFNPMVDIGIRPFSPDMFYSYNPSKYSYNGTQGSDGMGYLKPNLPIKIEASIEGYPWIEVFTGYVGPDGFQEQNQNVTSYVSVTCYDIAKKLTETPAKDANGNTVSFVGFKICDSSDPDNSLVHSIASLGGVDPSDIITDDITNYTLDYVVLKENVWTELANLAFAWQSYLYVDGSGKLRFVGSRFADDYVEPTTPVEEWIFNKDNIFDWTKSIKMPDGNDVNIQFETYELSDTREIIYKFIDKDTWDGERNHYVIASHDTTDKWTDPTKTMELKWQTETSEAIELAFDIDSVPTIESENNAVTIENYVVYADKAEIRLANNTSSDAELYNLIIRGRPIRHTKNFNIVETNTGSISTYGRKVLKIVNNYFGNDVTARTIAAWLRDWRGVPRRYFSIEVPVLFTAEPGAWVKVDLVDSGFDVGEYYCQVVAVSHTIVQKVKGKTTITLVERPYNWSNTSSGDIVFTAHNNTIDYIPERINLTPTYTDIVEGFDEGGGTTTPEPLSLEVSGLFKAIRLKWSRQTNLTNLDHYDVQVSEDNTNWYSLKFDGTDWKDVYNGLTEVNVEYLLHSNIPFEGTEENPIGKTLYYRVRSVTKLSEVSAWATGSATTLTVDKGDIAANSIDANKVEAGAINTKHLAVSDNLFSDDDPMPDDATLWDFQGRLGSNTGLFPEKNYNQVAFVSESSSYPAKANFRGAIACFPENEYPTYVVPTKLSYEYLLNGVGSVELWVRPYHNVNANNKYYITDYTSNWTYRLYFHDHRFYFNLKGSSGTVTLYSDYYSSNTQLQKWHHIKITWDTTTQNYKMWVDGSLVGSSNTNIGSYVGSTGYIQFGNAAHHTLGYEASALICDVLIHSDADEDLSHYNKNRPWYDPRELAAASSYVRITPYAISIMNGEIDITDKWSRRIRIGNSTGMLSLDSKGHITHDIATAYIQDSEYYCGHYHHFNTNGSEYILLSSNSASSYLKKWTPLTAYTANNENIKAVMLRVHIVVSTSSSSNLDSIYEWAGVWGRPQGSNWNHNTSGSCPLIYTYETGTGLSIGGSGYSFTTTGISGMMVVPVNYSNKQIEIYFDAYKWDAACALVISQLGVYI